MKFSRFLRVFPAVRIENYILKKIDSGEYKIGEQIPTEYELCEQFHVGRMTVNKALNNLERRNLIRRISGKGSFVMRRVSRSVTALGSFTMDMERAGMKASSKLLEFRIAKGRDFPRNPQRIRKYILQRIHHPIDIDYHQTTDLITHLLTNMNGIRWILNNAICL